MNKKPASYSLEDYGVDSASYFQGAGTAYTEWDACYVGIGESAQDAGEDAIENAASDYDVSQIANDLSDVEDAHEDCETCDGCETHAPLDCTEHNETCEVHHYAVLSMQDAE